MISEDFIKTLAKKYQTTELNARREYVQHLFLSSFYRQPEASKVYFKGGTALRILYGSPRFSEDLDFNATSIHHKGIETLLLDTLTHIEKENIELTLEEAKQTSGGFLSLVRFHVFERPIDIQLEISLRAGKKKGEVIAVVSDFIPVYNVVSVTQEQLVFEKIRALMERGKPRDFYDLYFLLRSNLLPPKKKAVLPQVLKKLQKLDIDFARELKAFLPKTHWTVIRDFQTTLRREIERNI